MGRPGMTLGGVFLAEEFDHPGRGHPGFRAGQVIAALVVGTYLVLWARIAPERLTAGEQRALADARSLYMSVVTFNR